MIYVYIYIRIYIHIYTYQMTPMWASWRPKPSKSSKRANQARKQSSKPDKTSKTYQASRTNRADKAKQTKQDSIQHANQQASQQAEPPSRKQWYRQHHEWTAGTRRPGCPSVCFWRLAIHDSCKLTRCHLLALLDLLGFGCQLAHMDYLSDTLGIYIYMYISIYVYLYIGGVYIYIYMYTCVMQYDRTRSKQQTLHIREGGGQRVENNMLATPLQQNLVVLINAAHLSRVLDALATKNDIGL